MIWFGGVTFQFLLWHRSWDGVIFQKLAAEEHEPKVNLPRGRFERSISTTISIVCVISNKHSFEGSGHTGLTSIDILCQEASKSLCPSNKLDIPAFPLQGRSFKKGVRFSVQTTSLGNVPCKR